LRKPEEITEMIEKQLNNLDGLIAGMEPSMVNIAKNAKQAGILEGTALIANETLGAFTGLQE
jgi:hypothetical protein